MEFINRIEISGVVGTVRKQSVADSIVANFSVVTETSYNDRNGCAVVETTWHNVVAWQNSNMPDLETIERGSHVNVQGRLRTRRYTDANGESRAVYEIIAARVHILPND